MHVPLVVPEIDRVQLGEELVERDEFAIVRSARTWPDGCIERRRVAPVLHAYLSHMAAVLCIC
jgi:hypothetical protein